MTELKRNNLFNNDMSFREKKLTEVSMKIEQRFGRLKPTLIEYRAYYLEQSKTHELIRASKHFEEKDWPEWKHSIAGLTKPIELETVSSEDEMEFDDPPKRTTFADVRQREPVNR